MGTIIEQVVRRLTFGEARSSVEVCYWLHLLPGWAAEIPAHWVVLREREETQAHCGSPVIGQVTRQLRSPHAPLGHTVKETHQ